MAYIGQRPVIGRYIKLDQISSGFNGSNTGFSMTAGSQAVFPGTARNLLLSLGGVIQEPDTDFTISGSTLTFTTAPVANTTFFGVIYGDMQATGTPSDGTVLPASIASSGNFSFPQLTVTSSASLLGGAVFNENGADVDFRVEGDTVTHLLFVDANADRVGIGTSSPSSKLTIEGAADNVNSELKITATGISSGYLGSDSNGLNIGTDTAGIFFKTGVTGGGSVGATGSVKMAITSAGLVGIGETNPAGSLHINADSGVDGPVFESGGTNNTNHALIVRDSNATQLLRINNNGKIGIGTTSPDRLLHVRSTGDALFRITSGDGSAAYIELGDASNGDAGKIVYDNGDNLTFTTTNPSNNQTVEKLRIQGDGKVGIGEVSPAAGLDVKVDTNPVLAIDRGSANTANFNLQYNGTLTGQCSAANQDFQISASGASTPLSFFTNGSVRMTILAGSDGYVGMGLTNPSTRLEVKQDNGVAYNDRVQTASYNAARFFNSSGHTGAGAFTGMQFGITGDSQNRICSIGMISEASNNRKSSLVFATDDDGNRTEKLRITGDGKIGFNEVSPSKQFSYAYTQSANYSSTNAVYEFLLWNKANISSYPTCGSSIQLRAGNTSAGGGNITGVRRGAANQGDLAFSPTDASGNPVEKIRITSAGKVGIGTTDPQGGLHVETDTITVLQLWSNAGFGRSKFSLKARDTGTSVGFFQITTESTVPSVSELMSIRNDGDVMFGTENNDSGGSAIGNNFGFVYKQSGHAIVRSGSTSVSGASGIAYTAKFVDTGTSKAFRVMLAQTEMGSISVGAGGTAFNTTSDYRRKENVVDLTGAITRLKTLLPKRFNFVDEPSVTRDGFLAHEVTAVPEAVYGTKDAVEPEDNENSGAKKGDPIYQQLDQSKLVPLLTAALQEAISKIETLETKVAALEAA